MLIIVITFIIIIIIIILLKITDVVDGGFWSVVAGWTPVRSCFEHWREAAA